MAAASPRDSWTLRYAVASTPPESGGPQFDRNAAYAGPHLLVVAHGLQHLSSPDSPANLTIDELRHLDAAAEAADLAARLARAAAGLEETFSRLRAADPRWTETATMFTAMLWSGGHVAIAHIGTTRAYVLRDGILTQLTRDHTLGQLLVDEGSISAHEVGSDKRHSLIVGDLGSGQPSHRSLEITIRDVELADRYLLTAFGHQDVVSLDVVHDPSATPQAAAHAIAGNTRDDITVIVADVVDQPSSSDHPAVKRGGPWMNPRVEPPNLRTRPAPFHPERISVPPLLPGQA